MWYFNDGGHFWGMHWMWWGTVILIILLVIFIPWSARKSNNEKETPIDILKKRYAKGEINKEEYRERKKVLENEKD
jgi:putative membrane protein